MQQMKGVSISQGLAVGKIVVLTSAAAPEAQAGTPEEELARFQRAQHRRAERKRPARFSRRSGISARSMKRPERSSERRRRRSSPSTS